MYSKEEKFSLLSEMIGFAKSDNNFADPEYDFILAVASQLGVSKKEVDDLIENTVDKKSLHPESERILQFHRLVLLMNIDQENTASELQSLKNIGLDMGLRSEAIDTVLKEMHNYPNKVIPPKQLIDIFKRFYN